MPKNALLPADEQAAGNDSLDPPGALPCAVAHSRPTRASNTGDLACFVEEALNREVLRETIRDLHAPQAYLRRRAGRQFLQRHL